MIYSKRFAPIPTIFLMCGRFLPAFLFIVIFLITHIFVFFKKTVLFCLSKRFLNILGISLSIWKQGNMDNQRKKSIHLYYTYSINWFLF